MGLQDQLRSLDGSSIRRRRRGRAFRTYGGIATGAALAVIGASRRNWAGAVLASAGGYLVFLGFRNAERSAAPVHVQSSVTINKPLEEVYSFWNHFENLPRFMQHLHSVNRTGEKTSHWEARTPFGASIGWDAEITDERENHFLLWRSLPGSLVEHRGSVEFRSAPAGRGTIVIVAMDIRPPAGKLGAGFAMLFGERPEQQIKGDLRRMKALLETGEIPTTQGQSSGRRSAFVRMMHAAKGRQSTARERTAS